MRSTPVLAPEPFRRAESPRAESPHSISTLLASTTPLLLLSLAIGLRLPDLMAVPGFTDETIDVRVAMNLLHGQWSLVDAEPYIGSLFNGMLAAAFLMFGPAAFVPRLLVALCGAFTVVLTYYLGRRWAGPLCGLLAAGFVATSEPQIFLSHIAWSNCITPLFSTATMLVVAEAAARKSRRLLPLAGCLYGLLLQTHVSAVFLTPALIVQLWVGSRASRAWLRSWWSVAALLAALGAYANVIAFNVLNSAAWEVAARQKDYAYVALPSLDTYLSNLMALSIALVRMLGATFDGSPSPQAQLAAPSNLVYLSLVLGGTVLAFRRRLFAPLAAVAGTALMLPYVNMNYDVPFGVRYLGFLLPPLYVLLSLPLCWLLDFLRQRSRSFAIGLLVAIGVLLAFPAVQFFRFADAYKALSATSPTILALNSEIGARYRAGLIGGVLLDTQLDWVYTAPGGRALRAFALLFDLQQVPQRTVWMEPNEVKQTIAGADADLILIMSAASRERLGNDFDLVRIDIPDQPDLFPGDYWAYDLPLSGQKRGKMNST